MTSYQAGVALLLLSSLAIIPDSSRHFLSSSAQGGEVGAWGWTDVTTYGAIGNDQKDDTAAIQAALQNIAPTGGCLYFPPGTFLVQTTVSIPSNIAVRGSGCRASVVKAVGTLGHVFRTAAGAADVSFHDIGVDGSGTASGIHLQQVNGLYLERTAVSHTWDHGVWADHCVRGIITRCLLEDTGRHYLSSPSTGGGAHAITLGNDTFQVVVAGCSVLDNHTAGILSYQSSSLVYARNTLEYTQPALAFAGLRVANGDLYPSATTIFANVTRGQPHGIAIPQNVVTGAQSRCVAAVANVLSASANAGVSAGGSALLFCGNVVDFPNVSIGPDAIYLGHQHAGQQAATDMLFGSNSLYRPVQQPGYWMCHGFTTDRVMCTGNAIRDAYLNIWLAGSSLVAHNTAYF